MDNLPYCSVVLSASQIRSISVLLLPSIIAGSLQNGNEFNKITSDKKVILSINEFGSVTYEGEVYFLICNGNGAVFQKHIFSKPYTITKGMLVERINEEIRNKKMSASEYNNELKNDEIFKIGNLNEIGEGIVCTLNFRFEN